ncbi:hypothetical protein GUITHDRAFT_119658 [Guillardia theta CCMP2712]|uniref:DUF676 domain-containing protein n=1 Tax=Guillardia theta (strain CCMP2712) TaxID=905079 RepID=L1IE31_GUITC|nr:hypothetical protein GUITHDRAFT_119658 [Guillardia theta CCMP2712]EKX34164.1 hypothetical protein GUITHDRAFT_119658 [Guillardia theta CCMP2712]|eukprot:XP_005821144.1 hypothetical protein GUITHDRAFT_119658 [Guillardia theta CCMP2712]
MFAHFQVLVHLDGFRNLDLFHQGEYAIGVRVYSETTNRAARPTKFIEKSNAHVTQPLASGSPAYSGGINDEDSSFRCSSFYIRYREETHQINEAVTFDVELPVPNDFVFEPCVLQFELLFQKPNKARALGAQDGPPTLNRLLQVATHKFRFLPSQQGCFGHCHLTFDDMHTCIVEAYACCVLSCFTAGRCELLPRMFIPPEPEKKKGKKGKEEEVPPPVVGTFTGNPNFLACETGGKSFPPLLTGLENEERRYVNSKDGLTERSGRSDASSTSSSSTGSKNAGGKTTSESSDRFPSVAETNLDFVMQVLSECLANDQQRRSLILRDAAHQVREEAKTSGEGKALLLASAGAFKRMTEEVLKLWLAFFDVFPEIAPAFMVSTEVSSARILQDRFEETTFTEEVESCIHFDSSRSMRAHDALVRRHRKRGKGGWKQSPFEDISCKIDENNGVLIFRQVQDGNRRRGEEGGGGGVGGISGGGGGGGGGRIPRTESGSERIFDYKRAGVSTEMFGDLSRMLQESGIRSPSSQEGPKTQVHVHKALLQATRGVDWSPSNAGRGEHAEEVERLSPHGRADQGEQEEVDGESLAAEICSSPHFKMKPNLSPTPGGPEGGIGRGGSSSSGSSNCPPRFFAAELKTMSQLRGGNETLEDGMHLYVFAHGFQGNQYDLRMLKNHMADLFPNADFLLSR